MYVTLMMTTTTISISYTRKKIYACYTNDENNNIKDKKSRNEKDNNFESDDGFELTVSLCCRSHQISRWCWMDGF